MRNSGIELLRSLSIFLILVVHVINLVIGAPGHNELIQAPIPAITTITFESLSIVCVNVFIIISGWFGIRPNSKGLCKLIFQCVFFFFIDTFIGFFTIGCTTSQILKDFVSAFFYGWFISAYIMLYLISPVINDYISTHTQRDCEKILVPSYVFMCVFGWLFSTTTGNQSTFMSGYSTLFLFLLYFAVRYIKTFYFDKEKPTYAKHKTTRFWITAYVIFTMLNILMWILFTMLKMTYLSSIIFLYTSPIVIAQSYCLFKVFINFQFKSKFINKIGASSLSIMLFHFCCGGYYFKLIISNIYNDYFGFSCISLIYIFLVIISTIAITFDQIRILIWNKISQQHFKYI